MITLLVLLILLFVAFVYVAVCCGLVLFAFADIFIAAAIIYGVVKLLS